VEERDALVARVGPEERRANALGQRQADGAARQRPGHVRDRRLTQLPLEDDGKGREPATEQQVGRRLRAQWPQQERRVHDRPGEEQAGKNGPGHDARRSSMTPE
jgi:hypothetical protein